MLGREPNGPLSVKSESDPKLFERDEPTRLLSARRFSAASKERIQRLRRADHPKRCQAIGIAPMAEKMREGIAPSNLRAIKVAGSAKTPINRPKTNTAKPW